MVGKVAQLQALLHEYRAETGLSEVNMRDMVDYAVAHGMSLPKPIDPRDRLAREFSDAARQEVRFDGKTGRPYRANHAITEMRNGAQLTFWIDIDQAPRTRMQKSLIQRREQIVGDAVQLSLDLDHWNSVNALEEPIAIILDFEFDVQLRKLGSSEMDKAS